VAYGVATRSCITAVESKVGVRRRVLMRRAGRGDRMRRREVISLLGGAGSWLAGSSVSWGQVADPMRRIGVLADLVAEDPRAKVRLGLFVAGLREAGWVAGRNLGIEYRWGAADTERSRDLARELVALRPEVILASGSPAVSALREASRDVPLVFVSVADPVAAGFVESLARPGGRATGFALFEDHIGGKWLQLLKEVAPDVTRAAVLHDPAIAAGVGQFAAIRDVAQSLEITLLPIAVSDAGAIEADLAAFAGKPNGGILVTASPSAGVHRDLIITLAARHRLPAVYAYKHFVSAGGLLSYGPDLADPFRQAAVYVDRILKGEQPGVLPVQAPTNYEFAINLKTAIALGLIIPPTLLARADEVIE
jgi:putative ABC transport system substrate-binding protein